MADSLPILIEEHPGSPEARGGQHPGYMYVGQR
jgi:hypothetical protein